MFGLTFQGCPKKIPRLKLSIFAGADLLAAAGVLLLSLHCGLDEKDSGFESRLLGFFVSIFRS
jgi:hypothetical protein